VASPIGVTCENSCYEVSPRTLASSHTQFESSQTETNLFSEPRFARGRICSLLTVALLQHAPRSRRRSNRHAPHARVAIRPFGANAPATPQSNKALERAILRGPV